MNNTKEEVFNLIEKLKSLILEYDSNMKKLEEIIIKIWEKNEISEEIKNKLSEFQDFLDSLKI